MTLCREDMENPGCRSTLNLSRSAIEPDTLCLPISKAVEALGQKSSRGLLILQREEERETWQLEVAGPGCLVTASPTAR